LELHLDLIGGLAGDMFVAALLDAFPQLESSVIANILALRDAYPVTCSSVPHADSVLRGRRFEVRRVGENGGDAPSTRGFSLRSGSPPQHVHGSWKSIRANLEDAALDSDVRAHAVGIFKLLAEAESFVHGIDVDRVCFHEVGGWDSVADIVGAATLIHATGAARWTCSPAPIGRGRVRTAHGVLPVPAPATARLLLGMPTIDDGVEGERVTPTGAAILRYLCHPSRESGLAVPKARALVTTGTGFGLRLLPNLSNHVRVLCFEEVDQSQGGHRQIHVLEFEVDDQSAEDLATGLDRLRGHAAVLDVTQSPVFGKKGRMMTHIRVLARQECVEQVMDACFTETTTIGLRHSIVHGVGLKRALAEIDIDGRPMRVKLAERPGGRTAKAEADDVSSHEGHARRAKLRHRAEFEALNQ
jgi:uncharacterized protein (TIGR00299 family) protein